jgi:hypothetical protein
MNTNPQNLAKQEQIANLEQELIEAEAQIMQHQKVGDNHTANMLNKRCAEIKKSIDALKMEITDNNES